MARLHHRVKQAVRERLLVPLSQLTWPEVIVAVAIGVLGGIFPIPLVTSVVTLVIGWYVRCSTAELVLGSTANLFCTPLQFALLPSLARLMGCIVQVDTTPFTAHALQQALGAGYGAFVRSCGRMILFAATGWFLVAIPCCVILSAVQRWIAHRQLQKETAE